MRVQNGNSIYLFEPQSQPTITCVIYDQGANCTYTQSITLAWETKYYCGNVNGTNGSEYWRLVICQNGVSMCLDYHVAKSLIAQGLATLGACDPTKVDSPLADQILLRVFPNPSSGIVNIEMINLANNARLEIYDVSGRKMLEENVETENGIAEKHLDLSHLATGTYFVQLNDGRNVVIEKFTIRH